MRSGGSHLSLKYDCKETIKVKHMRHDVCSVLQFLPLINGLKETKCNINNLIFSFLVARSDKCEILQL